MWTERQHSTLALAPLFAVLFRRRAGSVIGTFSHAGAAYEATETRILILGGGFVGVETALTLDKEPKEIIPEALPECAASRF